MFACENYENVQFLVVCYSAIIFVVAGWNYF